MGKKWLVFLSALVFAASITWVFAADVGHEESTKIIKCCIEGKCVDSNKQECAMRKGTQVQDCKQCAGAEKKDK
jgi:hypothetical protein